VTAENIDTMLAAEKPDHIVVATGAHYRRDGFQGPTGKPIPGWEAGKCVAWDQVALDKTSISGDIAVIDEMADVAAPLTAVKLAKQGTKVTLITKWPMISMETAPEVYLHRSTTTASFLSNRALRGLSRIDSRRQTSLSQVRSGQVRSAQLNEPKSWGISDMCTA
jgi:hypothetical protein